MTTDDRGIMDTQWDLFANTFLREATPAKLRELRVAFYAGAWTLLQLFETASRITSGMSSIGTSLGVADIEAARVRVQAKVHDEIDTFLENVGIKSGG